MMLFLASLTICCGFLLLVNREAIAARNAASIKSLSFLYGRRATGRAADAATPRRMIFLSVTSVSMGTVAITVIFFRMSVPASAFSVWSTAVLGILQLLSAGLLFLREISRRRKGARVARYASSLGVSALIAAISGAATLASLAVLLAAKAG
ncbi:hypothetical protein RBR11_17010 [Microbacterium sp. ASV81]|uniref:Uncharacterized protein n=1 Tax=Microbacterium capsulatum TaxID=3041921 RepID=A0ABU0XKE5_9MICO|nr:hypothetical protein [Microbacterium sp. ASV81]